MINERHDLKDYSGCLEVYMPAFLIFALWNDKPRKEGVPRTSAYYIDYRVIHSSIIIDGRQIRSNKLRIGRGEIRRIGHQKRQLSSPRAFNASKWRSWAISIFAPWNDKR